VPAPVAAPEVVEVEPAKEPEVVNDGLTSKQRKNLKKKQQRKKKKNQPNKDSDTEDGNQDSEKVPREESKTIEDSSVAATSAQTA